MMTHGSIPNESRWVIPEIQKLCPLIKDKPSFSQTVLHWDRNQEHFIGNHFPSAISNANRGACAGMDMFEER